MSSQPTIVVAAYNRPHALQGLLDSLLLAQYPAEAVRLVISIDGAGDRVVAQLADAFVWPFGPKEVIKHPQRLGLKQHIMACGALAALYGSIILLEDDLEVAPGFYEFAAAALAQYQEPLVAGISLYSYQVSEVDYLPFKPDTDGLDAYLMQFPSSWGLAFTAAQWQGFTDWLQAHPTPDNNTLPPFVQRWGPQSWKKLYVQYLLSADKYFIYPTVSFSTNKGYAGAHFALQLTLFDVPLHHGGPLVLPPTGQMHRFTVNFAPTDGTMPIASNPPPSVAVAEYHNRVSKGLMKYFWLGKWVFVARYNFHNYFNAIYQRLGL